MPSKLAATFCGLAALGAGAYLFAHRSHAPDVPLMRDLRSSEAKAAATERSKADVLYAIKPAEAEAKYRAFVDAHKVDKDPGVQDEVGEARLRLGYLAAKRRDFPAARAVLRQAALEYRGTGKMGADFGGIPDQAAYQAAVTLVAEGKKTEAEKAFVQFIKDRPLSPLVSAAERRLVRLSGGKPRAEWEALLQAALDKQREFIRFETSVCGPRAIAQLLKLLGKPEKEYKEIARLCGTTDKGTTLEGMAKGLEALGIQTWAVELGRKDVALLHAPAIVLIDDHYLVLTAIDPGKLTLYDPALKSEKEAALPPVDTPQYSLIALSLSDLHLKESR